MGNSSNCIGCLSCFYVGSIYTDHNLTGLSHSNSRLNLQGPPTVFLGGQLCGPHMGCPPGPDISLTVQKT